MIATLCRHAGEVGGMIGALAIAHGVGRWVLRPGSLRDRVAEAVVAALLGLIALSAVVGVLLAAGLCHTVCAPVLLLLWTVVGLGGWRRRGSPELRADPGPAKPAPAWIRGAVALCALSFALGALGACAPATSWDATYCHFAMPAYWVREGAMPHRLDWPFYYYPLNLHMLFAAGLALGGPTPAALVGVACFAAAAVLIWRWAAWVGGPAAGACAALATLGCFSLGLEADSGNVEPGLLAYGAAAMFLLARARDEGNARLLALAAVMTGFAYGVKMTAFTLVVPWTALLARPGPFSRRRVAAWGAAALLLGAPWYLRAALATGNPFYPAFSGLFPSPYVILPTGAELFRAPARFLGQCLDQLGGGYAGLALAALACVAGRTLRETRLPGAAGFVLLTVAGAALTMPWSGDHLPRFASVTFPALLAAGGLSWGALAKTRPRIFAAGLAVAAAAVLAAQVKLGYRLAFKLPVIAGAEDPARFLSDRMNTFPLLERLNRMPDPPGRPIRALLTDGRSLYLTREFVYGADHHAFVDYARLKDGAAFHRRLVELGVTHVVLNRLATAHTDTLINRNRMDPTFLDPAHFRLLESHQGAPRERFAPAETAPAELYEFLP